MKRQQALERLERIIEQDLPTLERNAIIPQDSGYLAFGRYHIQEIDDVYEVTKYSNVCGHFTSLRGAISWCIADKYNQHRLRWDIHRLEKHKLMVQSDFKTRSALARRSKKPHDGLDAKPETRQYQLAQIDFQLDKCINQAKYWQIRGFNNETQRTGRTPSHRTNR